MVKYPKKLLYTKRALCYALFHPDANIELKPVVDAMVGEGNRWKVTIQDAMKLCGVSKSVIQRWKDRANLPTGKRHRKSGLTRKLKSFIILRSVETDLQINLWAVEN